MRRNERAQVYRVTAARQSRTADIRRRYRRYAISMGIRTLCFVAAVLTQGPARWVLFAAALILPYVAVVMANAGRERDNSSMERVILPSRTQLPPIHPTEPPQPPDSPASPKRSRNTF
jgi:low temperature requirement protein LtrA